MEKFKKILIQFLEATQKQKKVVLALSCLVVFITTYMLILPAFTLDKEEAESQGGIDVPETVEVSDENAEASEETGQDDPSDEAEQTESPEAEKAVNTDNTDKSEIDSESADEDSDEEKPDMLTYDGGSFTITVEDTASVLPENTEIKVKEIEKSADAKAYKSYFDDSLAAVQAEEDGDKVTDLQFAKFYDITLVADGKEIKLSDSDTVSVMIEYDKKNRKELNVENKDNLRIIHFAENSKTGEEEAEVLSNTEANVEVNTDSKDRLTDTTFDAGSFSVYAVVYTVDFEYSVNGKTYQFSLPGGGKVALSELIEKLGIIEESSFENTKAFLAEVDKVEFSDTSLVKVTQKDGDWELKSLGSFESEEVLTITMKNGDVISVKVTDPATQDVSSLLTDVEINATKNADGSYTVYAGQAYGIDLSFKEQPSGIQFDMTDGFYYPLPAGLFDADSLAGKAMIELSGGDHAGETVELDYTIQDNKIVFSWPDQTSDAYNQLKEAIYTNFKIHIEAKFEENAHDLEFNDKITKVVDVKNDGKADVSKHGTYNPATNSIDYSVYVKSTGICKNVVVTDTISGTALTYNNDARATSNKNQSLPTPTASGNGFTFTIPQMGDGEVVTVKYSAAVNLDALHTNPDGTLGTVSETGNKVTVTPSNHPGDEDETSGKDLENKISYSTISKTSSVGATGEDGHATVTWTIKANQNANVSMAGHTISDMIDSNSQSIMKYSGTGITVVRKNANGTVVGTETIPWSSLTSHSDSAWTWTVPNSSPDTGKLSYEITYTTDVDANGQLFNTNVRNTGSSDIGGSSSSSGTVTPPGGALTARKLYISKDMTGKEKTVTWEVNFDVPAGGLDSAEIDDTLPNYWNGSSPIIDSYKDGSITITPELAFGEGYEVSTYTDGAGKQHMKVVFHKIVDEHQVAGLSGTGSKRKIRVRFKTVLNDDWLAAAENDQNAQTHQNNANVILNGQTLGTQASVKIDVTQPEMTKSHGSETVNVVNNNQLPAWQFFVTLKGVSDDTFDENGQIVILDDYNSKYLDWYPHAYASWDTQNGQVFGGDSNNKFQKSSDDKVMSKVGDGQLKIVLNQADLPRDANGDYYPLYTIPYYLTVKDPIALQKLIAHASYTEPGAIDLYNTASNDIFGTAEDKVSYEVPVVNKTGTEPTLTNGVYKLHYTININERALQLGDSDELVMTDEYSNISIDYTTLKIYEYINGTKTEVNDVVWDRSGYTSTYYLKNATHYVIEYDAHLSGEGEKINATQSNLTYTNTAEVFGKKSTWEKTKTIDSSSSGGSRTFRVKVLKHVKGNASQGLPGAVFQLWWYPSTQDNPNGKDNRPAADDPGWENTGQTLTTDANGYAQTMDNMHIHSQTWYKLVEVTPPQGYTLKTTHYTFWITEGQVADYSKYVYLNDDVLAINNTPELPETVDVSVQKVWDDNSDLTLRRDINVHLYADGVPYNELFTGDQAANAREDADKTLHLNEDGTSETYTWEGLPSGYTYSVVEDPVPGYATVYSPKNTLTGGTLKITNKRNTQKTAISIDKEWSEGTTPSEDITVQLKRKVSANAPIVVQNGANNAGATGMHITDYSVPAGANVNLIWTYKNNWGYDSPALNIYNYGTKELIQHYDKISGSPTQHTVGVTVPSEGIIIAFEDPYLGSLGDFTRQFDFDIQVTSTGSGGSTEDVNFTNERHYLTLSPDNNWHLDVDGLLISDDDGAYTYYIEEVGVNDNTQTPEEAGYEVSYTNNDGITNGTIKVKNEKEPPAKIQVTKSFSGVNALPDGFRITNNYNDDVFTVSNKTDGTGTASDPYTWVIDDIPAGTEVEFTESGASVDGHTLTIKANGTAQPEGSVTASASGTAAKPVDGEISTVAFVNEYEKDTPRTGSLKIRKSISENGSKEEVSEAVQNKLAGTYTFSIYKDEACNEPLLSEDGTPVRVTLTLAANGQPVTSPEVTGLEAGDYWIKETLPANDSLPVTNPVKVTVEAGKTGEAAPVADFVNDYETTNITVKKQWTDIEPKNHSNDRITFALYQIAEDSDGNVLKEGEYTGQYTKTITGSGEVQIEGLPVNGTINGVAITYRYYVSEMTWPTGYVPVTGQSETEDGMRWTLNNIGPQPPDKNTSVNVTKVWKDQNGNDVTASGHDDDVITFKLTQTAVESEYVPVILMLHNSNGSEYSNKTYFVKKNGNFTLTLNKPWSLRSTAVTVTSDQGFNETWSSSNTESRDFTFRNINSALTINANLNRANWAEEPENIPLVATYWSHSVSGTDLKDNIDAVIAAAGGGTAVSTQDYIYTLHKSQLEGAFTPSASDWVGTIANLPLYKKINNNTFYVYSYAVDEVTVNGETVIDKNTADGVITGHTDEYSVEVDQSTNTITNTERPKVDVDATKAWVNADDSTTPPEGAKVTFELYADGKATGKTVELDGTIDPESACYESAAWKALWKDLPKYSDSANTKEIDYSVKEVSGFAPYVNQNTDGVASGKTISNKMPTADIDIVKVDKGDHTITLEDATFTLQRIKSDEAPGNQVKYDGDVIATKTTDRSGLLRFEKIGIGYYEVKETDAPDGYIKSDVDTFYIKVDRSGVHMIQCDLSKPASEWSEITSGGIVSSITKTGMTAQATVENESGAELPHTGGIGTTIFYVLGTILVLGCGVVLASRRRVKRSNIEQ